MSDIILDIKPFPKPRMTRRDKTPRLQSKRVRDYFDWVNEISLLWNIEYVPIPLSITFIVPMSKSWTKKKKAEYEGMPHRQKPDLDNFIKAFKDALLEEDCHVWKYGEMKKVWGYDGQIIVHDVLQD